MPDTEVRCTVCDFLQVAPYEFRFLDLIDGTRGVYCGHICRDSMINAGLVAETPDNRRKLEQNQ